MNSDNVGLNPHHVFKKGITNTRWKCGGIMSWMQSSRHSAAHLPSFIKAQPKAILTYSSFPFLLRLTACGRVGWSGGWWSWWVVGGGSFGTSKWRQEEKLAGEGQFLTKDRDMKPDWAHSAWGRWSEVSSSLFTFSAFRFGIWACASWFGIRARGQECSWRLSHRAETVTFTSKHTHAKHPNVSTKHHHIISYDLWKKHISNQII